MTEENKIKLASITDLQVGDYVTVESWHERKNGSTGETYKDGSYVGEPLVVLHVEDPFVIVKSKYSFMGNLNLDSRCLNLAKISSKYYELLTKKEDK